MVFIRVLHSGRIGNWCSDGVFVEGGKPKNQKKRTKASAPGARRDQTTNWTHIWHWVRARTTALSLTLK